MMTRILNVFLIMVMISAGAYCISQFKQLGAAHADTNDLSQPVPSAPPSAALKNPAEDPSGFYGDLKDAKNKGGWLGVILVGLYGLCRLLGLMAKKFAPFDFFNKGRMPMIIASTTVVLAAGLDALFMGGKLSMVMMAMVFGFIGMLGTKPAVQ